MALYYCKVRTVISLSVASCLPAPVSCHLRNRTLHGPHRRKHFSRLHPPKPVFCVLSLDPDDALFSVVWRFCRCRRNIVGSPHPFSCGLDSQRADSFLGLPFYVRFFNSHTSEQGDLSPGRNIHVGRCASHSCGASLGQRQYGSASRPARVRQRTVHSGMADAAALGPR